MTPQKCFYALCASAALGLVLVVGIINWGGNALRTHANALAVAKAENDAASEQLIATKQLESELADLQDVSQLVDDFLPTEKDQSVIIAELFQYARESSITLGAINFTASGEPSQTSQTEPLVGSQEVLALPFSTSFSCVAPSTLQDFLGRIEQNRRKMQITTMSIARSTGSSDCPEGNLNVGNLSIEAYLRKS